MAHFNNKSLKEIVENMGGEIFFKKREKTFYKGKNTDNSTF